MSPFNGSPTLINVNVSGKKKHIRGTFRPADVNFVTPLPIGPAYALRRLFGLCTVDFRLESSAFSYLYHFAYALSTSRFGNLPLHSDGLIVNLKRACPLEVLC